MSDKEAFIDGLGTIRECIDCACLVSGGPTRCIACANNWYTLKPSIRRIMFWLGWCGWVFAIINELIIKEAV